MTPTIRLVGMQPPPNAIEQAEALVGRIGPLLHGRHPAVVGLVLIDLHAMMVAGLTALNPEYTELVESEIKSHGDAVRDLVPLIAEELRAEVQKQ